MSNLTLSSAPAVATIDQNNVLTVNWQPLIGPDGAFDQYSGWNIVYQAIGPAVTQFFPAPTLYSGGSLLFTQVLGASVVPYTLTMTAKAVSVLALTSVAPGINSAVYSGAINGGNNSFVGITFVVAGFVLSAGVNNITGVCTASTATTLTLATTAAIVSESHPATATMSPTTAFDSAPWETNGNPATRSFPTALALSNLSFSALSLLLGQALTVTLNSAYTGADQWQILWPDNTSTGWLPLASNVVVKSFLNPGTFIVTVQTRRNYSGAQFAPPTTLVSQIQQQIFVIDQQSPTSSTTQGSLTGNLGIGGQQGFEIVNNLSGNLTPNPWEVLARVLVRDTVTQELKLLVASTRFSNASSLFGTMAVDVFPIEGRPRSKELIIPPYELTTTSSTELTPVNITTTALPTLFVGKSVVQALGGTFQMQAQGGITPYIWSVDPLPEGVTMNTAGVINGTPLVLGIFTANFAVSDSSLPPSISHATLSMLVETDMLVQIAPNQTDANGNPLAQKGTSLGIAQVGTAYNVQMQVGNINSSSTLPGGLPPYQWSAPAGAFPAGLSINVDTGLITGTPQTYNSTTDFTTTYSITIQVTDSIGAKATQSYTMTLEPAALELGLVSQATVYTFQEFKLVVPIFGGKSPYHGLLVGFNAVDQPYFGSAVLIDGQVEIPIGGPTAATPGGFPTTGNRTFNITITDSTSTTFNGQVTISVETDISGISLIPAFITNATHPTDGSWGQPLSGSFQPGGDNTQAVPIPVSGSLAGFEIGGIRLDLVSNANTGGGNTVYTGVVPASVVFSTSDVYIISGFTNPVNNGPFFYVSSVASSPAGAPTGTITFNNPGGVATSSTVSSVTAVANAALGTTVYTGTITGGASNGVAGKTFTISGFTVNLQNNGTFLCIASSGSTLTLTNPYGAAETGGSYSATLTAGKALKGIVLGNGISTAIDPTNQSIPVYQSADTYTTGQLVSEAGLVYSATTFVPTATPPPNPAFWSQIILPPDSEWYGPAGSNQVFATTFIGNAQSRVLLNVDYQLSFAYVANGSGGNTVYTYAAQQPESASNAFQGLQFTVTGFLNTANNGTFTCTASDQNTLTLNNPSGVATFYSIGSSAALSNVVTFNAPTLTAIYPFAIGQQVYVQGTAETPINTQRIFDVATISGPPLNGPSTSFTVPFTIADYTNLAEPGAAIAIQPNPFAQAVSVNSAETISREYATLAHQDPATFILSSVAASVGTTAVYAGNIIGGANNAFAGYSFAVTGFTTSSNNGYFVCTASSTATLTLANSNAVIESHPALATGDIGLIAVYPHPYIVGNVVGLNPRKPYFDSPNLAAINGVTSPYSPVPLTARVEIPSTLPPGLSLDANTGLIYGTLVGTQSAPTVIQYTDAGGTVHGTATINWQTVGSAFQLIDNVIDVQPVQVPYNGNTAFTAPSGVTLQSASLLYGVLPRGLQVGASGNNITISGTPIEAGYFDCWFACQSTTGQQAYAYHRISTIIPSTVLTIIGWDDPAAPTIVNSFIGNALPNATIGSPTYGPSGLGVQLVATGGFPPYSWTSSPSPMNGTAPNLLLSSSGLISGNTPTAFSPNPATFNFTVTDSQSNTFTINAITITTQASGLHFTNSPFAIAIISGQAESYQLTAAGSANTPYTFQLSPNNTNALPAGISLSSSGLVSGTSTQSGYNKSVLFRVVDSLGAYNDQAFAVTVGIGLNLQTGPDFENTTTTNYLGYIDAGNVATINPAPSLSFYVVATGVVSTSTSTISVSLSNSALSVGTIQLNTGTRTALIPLQGPFNAGLPGNNDLVVSVTDSGVQITKTFQWLVYNDGSLIVTPSTGSYPVQTING